jgi:hypothetical protein
MQWCSSAAALLLIALLAYWWRGRQRRQATRSLSRTARTPIAQAAEGTMVKLVGRVGRLEKTLAAPLTGNECVCYELQVADTGSENGAMLVDLHEGVPFSLSDSTATIEVMPYRFRLVASAESARVWRTREAGPCERLLELYLQRTAGLAEHRGALSLLQRRWPLKAEESHIREGVTIAVYGIVEKQNEPAGATRLRLTGADDSPLFVSDDGRTFA